ncbi:MAG: hypothetical protein GX958_12350 [Desulfitobacterium sp.]|nr:hypothetical protein [Desulfitobacterium sp.]
MNNQSTKEELNIDAPIGPSIGHSLFPGETPLTPFERQVQKLQEQTTQMVEEFYRIQRRDPQAQLKVPQKYREEFFALVDKVSLSLMEDEDNFYGYFLMEMFRDIRFDLTSPSGVNFQGAKYVIYFNPILFLNLNLKQMETTIKHEILHILSNHLLRAKEFKGRYTPLAINLAMNVVVNTYLDYLPPYSVTLESVNLEYSLHLLPYKPFEYYVEEIQGALNRLEPDEDGGHEGDPDDIDENKEGENPEEEHLDTIESSYNPKKEHDLWEESTKIDEKTLQELTEKFINNAQKGEVPDYLQNIMAALKKSKGELPWNLYLRRLMGSIASQNKKTVTRRNRRQPHRLDLRGELRSYKAKILVALDISGSISDEEFNQALKEVLAIVKNYNHEITVIECDDEIRRVYQVKTLRDLQDRLKIRGGTRFSPVFEYANKHKFNLLIYFTDGQGEEKLQSIPRGYKTLWVISGRGKELSLKEPYGAVKKLKQVEIQEDSLTMRDVKIEGFSMQDMER